MRLLITRPDEDAEALASRLRAMGHEPVMAPLLTIILRTDEELDLSAVQALLVTSANGVRALGRQTAARAVPLYAVGDATARAAHEAGFARVESAGGDVAALARLVAARLDPKAGPLLQIAGTAVAGDLAGALGAQGFTVRRAVLYEARPAERLPDNVQAALMAGTLDGVLLYSPRTARALVGLIEVTGLRAPAGRLVAYCMSDAVAAAARALPFATVKVAAAPNERALLALVEKA